MSSDAVALLMGLLFGGLGALTVAAVVLYVAGAQPQRQTYSPPMSVVNPSGYEEGIDYPIGVPFPVRITR